MLLIVELAAKFGQEELFYVGPNSLLYSRKVLSPRLCVEAGHIEVEVDGQEHMIGLSCLATEPLHFKARLKVAVKQLRS